jgi:hypothetical protein
VVTMGDPKWFTRFGDIPGVVYTSPGRPGPQQAASAGGTSAASPILRRGLAADLAGRVVRWVAVSVELAHPQRSTQRVDPRPAEKLAEALELPGEPVDYHFAIQSVITALRPHRRHGATVFAEMERLCWLDLQLIRALPAAVSFERDGEQRFFKIEAFSLLTDMYLREGALIDAVSVADVAEAYEQGGYVAAQKARARDASVTAEDGRA